MSTIFESLFKDNFIDTCIENSFLNFNCIVGSSIILITIIVLFINVFALLKLANFYGHLNLEIILIILSFILLIIIELSIITAYNLLLEWFTFTQIFIVSLIIRKIGLIGKKTKNGLFIVLNTINLILFTIYMKYLIYEGDNEFINLIHGVFYIFTAIILSVYCSALIKKIKKVEKKEQKIYVKASYRLNAKNSIKSDESKNDTSKENSKDTSTDINKEKISEKDISKDDSSPTFLVISFDSTKNQGDFLYYSMRKKQLKPLYKLNMFCAIIEFLLNISKYLSYSEYFTIDKYKTKPSSIFGYIIFYLLMIAFIFNVSINFISFFWVIRKQYTNEKNKNEKNTQIEINSEKVLDNKFIRRETINMKNEKNKEITDFMKEDNKKFKKSFGDDTFTDIQDISSEKLDDDYNKENNENDLTEPLHNEKYEDNENIVDYRFSVPSNEAINRITASTDL